MVELTFSNQPWACPIRRRLGHSHPSSASTRTPGWKREDKDIEPTLILLFVSLKPVQTKCTLLIPTLVLILLFLSQFKVVH